MKNKAKEKKKDDLAEGTVWYIYYNSKTVFPFVEIFFLADMAFLMSMPHVLTMTKYLESLLKDSSLYLISRAKLLFLFFLFLAV